MTEMAKVAQGRLADLIRAAGNGDLAGGWLFLADEETSAETRCIILQETDAEDAALHAAALGYPRSSIDTATIEDIFYAAARLVNNPSDDQLARSFVHYCNHDSFISDVDAPVAPPLTEAEIAEHQRDVDRKFYVSLGTERRNEPCQYTACKRGAISLSIFCRPHHFESVKGKVSPFDD
ncbi:MAG: hypothetical protein QM759_08390 [Terricaulis sp.]